MKYTHLVPRKWGQSIHFDFRHKIPTDLVSYFGGKRQFQISLNNVSTRETLLVSQSLKILVQELFSDIRSGMEDLTLEDIKEILRKFVRNTNNSSPKNYETVLILQCKRRSYPC